MKLVTVVGTRPQFVKAAMISRQVTQLEQSGHPINEVLVNTGQHYDDMMSKVFFEQLGLQTPKYDLGIGSGSHGVQTGKALMAIEDILLSERPDAVLVYGDCNATLSGALAASKLNIPLAHVEAGLRSFNREMPEEINRIITDSISDALYCPTETAVKNLRSENAQGIVEFSGDVMFDCALVFRNMAQSSSKILDRLNLRPKSFCLCTVHRAENTKSKETLEGIFQALEWISKQVLIVMPMHPRTSTLLKEYDIKFDAKNIKIIDPVSYLDVAMLEINACVILTDSGGMQKEAFFHGTPCITLRNETEWVETVELGCNRLVGTEADAINKAFSEMSAGKVEPPQKTPYGDGAASELIVKSLMSVFG